VVAKAWRLAYFALIADVRVSFQTRTTHACSFINNEYAHAYSSSGRAACDQVTGSKVRWARETTSP